MRGDIANTFVRFGSYLALVLRCTYYFLAEFQRFSLDNSMIKKLYSADPEDEEENSKKLDVTTMNSESKSDKLNNAIINRKIFTYKYMRLW